MKRFFCLCMIILLCLLHVQPISADESTFTRGSFCAKLVEMLEIEYDVSNIPQVFDDVFIEDENYEAIITMYMFGYFTGDNSEVFMPDDPIFKSEVVAILVDLIFGEFTVPDNVKLSNHWCAKYAWKAVESGIIYDSDNLNDYAKISDLNIDQIRKYAPYNFNIEANGACGENLTWNYTQDGVLTIKGTGLMTDYVTGQDVPWHGKRYFKVIIEEGVRSIGNSAFYDAHVLNVSLPSTLYKIGRFSFGYCINLTEINIPDGVTNIANLAFEGCFALKRINVDPINEDYYDVDGVLCSKSGRTVTLVRYPMAREAKEYVIPDGIVTIGSDAFSECKFLEKITFCSSVKTIQESVFRSCVNLSEVKLNEGLKTIASRAFATCESIQSIEIPASVSSINAEAFSNCKNLKEINVDPINEDYYDVDGVLCSKSGRTVTLVRYPMAREAKEYVIPDGIVTIGSDAFSGCESLINFEIPESVTSIGSNSFLGCNGLEKIIIPGNVIEVKDYAFNGCYNLENITICEGTTSIGESAFDDCQYLSKVYIPESVKYIGQNAFRNNSFTYEHNFTIYGLPESYAKEYALSNKLRFVEVVEKVTVDVKEESGYIICNIALAEDIPKDDSKIFIATYKEFDEMENCSASNVAVSGSTNISIQHTDATTIIKVFIWRYDILKPLCNVTYIYL